MLFFSIAPTNTSGPIIWENAIEISDDFSNISTILIDLDASYRYFPDLFETQCRLFYRINDGVLHEGILATLQKDLWNPGLAPARIFVKSQLDKDIAINDVLFPKESTIISLDIPLRSI